MRKLGDDKGGQNMSLTTILLIVLGLVVVIFLIFGFSTGWSNLWDKFTAYGGGKTNVDTITQACALACNTNSDYGFCQQNRLITFDDGDQERGSCSQLAFVDDCPGITCDGDKEPKKCEDPKREDEKGELSAEKCKSGVKDLSSTSQIGKTEDPYCCEKK
jgi:hypothetical protein